jgi:DNA-binding NarL/FixJ family response regulator
LIVDDEPLARDTLRGLLGRDGGGGVAGECGSGEATVEAIRRPDIVFLAAPPGDAPLTARIPNPSTPARR